MSAPRVHSAVAEPCQLSPPSSSSACGRAGAQPLHQRGEVREAAELAVAPRQRLEVEMRERVRRGAAALEAEVLEQVLADQVRLSVAELTLGSRK